MSHLIELRQRISVIETIRKTTNAMRLISMSTHSRLRNKKAFLTEYRNKLESLLQAQGIALSLQDSHYEASTKPVLVIALGSHKGLCGTFNTILAHYVHDHLQKITKPYELIIVGAHLAQHLATFNCIPQMIITNLSSVTFLKKAQEVLELMRSDRYSSIIIYSNKPKTFFVHELKTTILSPITEINQSSVIDRLKLLYTKTLLQEVIFDSLLAEQATRFLAMDGATRNAEELIFTMKLNYNKLRQALITRELTDLAGGVL